MQLHKLLLPSTLLLLTACSTADMREQRTAKSDTTQITQPLTAATEAGQAATHPEKKMIRTADIRCKVPDVLSAVTRLERQVIALGGIIVESNISNNGGQQSTTLYNDDSLQQTQTYATTAMLTLRIPSVYLDSVVNAIPAMASFIDSRSLRQNDVTLQYLGNEWRNDAGAISIKEATTNAQKDKDKIAATQYKQLIQDQTISRKLETLKLTDDVAYATLTVAMQQPEQVLTQIIANPDRRGRTLLLLQLKTALYTGWINCSLFVIFLLNAWPFLLLLAGGLFAYKKWKRKSLRPNPVV